MIVTSDLPSIVGLVQATKGSVISYPTETFYALGALYKDRDALKRICEIKGRNITKGMILLVSDMDMASTIAFIDNRQAALVSKFWPGPLTVLLEARGPIDPLLAPDGKVALRISCHSLAAALVAELGPITSTSANPSGIQPATTPEEVMEYHFLVDGILDGGETRGGLPSTIIDIASWPPACLRQGAIPFETIVS